MVLLPTPPAPPSTPFNMIQYTGKPTLTYYFSVQRIVKLVTDSINIGFMNTQNEFQVKKASYEAVIASQSLLLCHKSKISTLTVKREMGK